MFEREKKEREIKINRKSATEKCTTLDGESKVDDFGEIRVYRRFNCEWIRYNGFNLKLTQFESISKISQWCLTCTNNLNIFLDRNLTYVDLNSNHKQDSKSRADLIIKLLRLKFISIQHRGRNHFFL